MSDTLNALIDFLSDPETNGPPELRDRVAGMNENERREALARATREAHEMQVAVDHEVEVAATRERNRSLASHVRAQTDEVNSRFSAASRGTGVGPWVVNGLRHPLDTAASGVIALENLRRFLADQPGRYELAPSMQAEIDQGRVDAAAHPVSDLTGKIGGGYAGSRALSYLAGAMAGLPQSFMSSPGYLTGIARYLGNVGLSAATNAAQDAMASPDRPETFQESARDTLTSPWPWLVGLAGEGLGYAARNADANANQAARLRLDSLGVHGGEQQGLAMSAEPRGAAEFAAARGMDPSDFARRGAEGGGIGRFAREAEALIDETGIPITSQADTIADSLAARRNAIGQRLDEILSTDVRIDTPRVVAEMHAEAQRLRGMRDQGSLATARELEKLANDLEAVNRQTVERPVWSTIDEDVPFDAIPGMPGAASSGTGLAVRGAPAARGPILEQTGTVAESVVQPMTPGQATANRQFVDSLHRFDKVPVPGASEARSWTREHYNAELDRALEGASPALRDEARALSREYSVIGPQGASDGLETILRHRAANTGNPHLEAAAAAGASGNLGAAGVRSFGATVFQGPRISDLRSNFNRGLSDLGRGLSPEAVGAQVIPAMRSSQALPSFQLPHLHLEQPGGQPAAPPDRAPGPLQTTSPDDDDMRGFRPVDPSAPSTAPPTSGTPPLDDDDMRGFRPLY